MVVLTLRDGSTQALRVRQLRYAHVCEAAWIHVVSKMTAPYKHKRDTWSIIRSLSLAQDDTARRTVIGDASLSTLHYMYTLIHGAGPGATRYMTPARFTGLCKRVRGFYPNPDFLIKVQMAPGINRHSVKDIVRTILATLTPLNDTDSALVLKRARVMLVTGPSVHDLLDNLQSQCNTHIAGHPRS